MILTPLIASYSPSTRPTARPTRRATLRCCAAAASWPRLEELLPSSVAAEPRVIDAALAPSRPTFSDGTVVLYRERNGWCPYSERVWLALEHKSIPFETVLIDNTGGGRPSWYSGETPQIRWADGSTQKESLDIVRALDAKYPETPPLWPPAGHDAAAVAEAVAAFRQTFPRGARPSSRAAFLFQGGGGALPRSTFEATLDGTDELLGRTGDDGPFFLGGAFSAADVAWAPFLERYAAQLPCLHSGLVPRDGARWPHLARWYDAMESDAVPAYACRVRGDAASWRAVLAMAGFGNAGLPPEVIADAAAAERAFGSARLGNGAWWEAFAASRPHVAASPAEEAAARLTRNRAAVAADAVRRGVLGEGQVDGALREVAEALVAHAAEAEAAEAEAETAAAAATPSAEAVALLRYLDARMCVPRDMGAPAAAAIRSLSEATVGGGESSA